MPTKDLYDYGFGRVWNQVYVNRREGYSTSVTDYHEHGFYEINLILSGNVKILLGDRAEEGTGSRIVLTRPGTPHYISCKPDTLYSRLYLVFTDDFIADSLPEWPQLAAVFAPRGTILPLTPAMTEQYKALIEAIGRETSRLRQRLLTCCLLSHLADQAAAEIAPMTRIPPYLLEAIAYLEQHYAEKILAADLAKVLHIGRTTLMTEFKKQTGKTLGEYLTHCRLGHAVRMLCEGKKLEYIAVQCGFSDSSGLIRSFKQRFGTTPRQYAETYCRLGQIGPDGR